MMDQSWRVLAPTVIGHHADIQYFCNISVAPAFRHHLLGLPELQLDFIRRVSLSHDREKLFHGIPNPKIGRYHTETKYAQIRFLIQVIRSSSEGNYECFLI